MTQRTTEILCVVGLALLALLLLGLGVRDCKRRERCEERGGRVERYNYRTVFVPQSCGSNCTIMVPVETSDWRCVGLPAERP